MSKNEPKKSIFLSYKTEIGVESFVARVCHCLERQANVDCYFHPEKKRAGNFGNQLIDAAKHSEYFILFLSKTTNSSLWQNKELSAWLSVNKNESKLVVININEKKTDIQLPSGTPKNLERIYIEDVNTQTLYCSDEIFKLLKIPAAPFDGLPSIIQELYEKEIINKYKTSNGKLSDEYIRKGYPETWPKTKQFAEDSSMQINPLKEEIYGTFRNNNSTIGVDARHLTANENSCIDSCNLDLTFPEAGPRKNIITPSDHFNVAILVSGGIAPGINAIISSITERHKTYEKEYQKQINEYHRVHLFSCMEGFNSLCEDYGTIIELDEKLIAREVNSGGSIIPTARAVQLLIDDPEEKAKILKSIAHKLRERRISILYVIGGEGSMRAAHAIWTVYNQKFPNNKLSIIGIPKTMDNDILWVWQSIGFTSAVEKARQIIIQLATEAASNPRVCIVQLFGSSSGYVVSHAALGSSVCDLALIPELPFNMEDVCEYMGKRLKERSNHKHTSPSGLIVMAETAIPSDFEKYIDDELVGLTEKEKEALYEFKKNGSRVIGQTPDRLRDAGLKIVSKVLESYIQVKLEVGNKYWSQYRVFTNAPRHIIRSIEPSMNDVAYGIRLGTMAVDMAMAGYTDCMVSQWLTEYVAVPLVLVILGIKDVPLKGIFWKTVIAKTGQIEFPSLSGI